MGRTATYFVSKQLMKKYILDFSIDEDGNKVPIRELFNNKEFQDKTGYYRYRNNMRESMALGTCTSLMESLGITEQSTYDYHFKKGNITKPFDEWSNLKHRNIKRTKKSLAQQVNDFKYTVIKEFYLDAEECITLNLGDIKIKALNKYKEIGFDEEDFDKDFRHVMKKYKVTDRMLIDNSAINYG